MVTGTLYMSNLFIKKIIMPNINKVINDWTTYCIWWAWTVTVTQWWNPIWCFTLNQNTDATIALQWGWWWITSDNLEECWYRIRCWNLWNGANRSNCLVTRTMCWPWYVTNFSHNLGSGVWRHWFYINWHTIDYWYLYGDTVINIKQWDEVWICFTSWSHYDEHTSASFNYVELY